ncbi:MFS transporter [Streptomyces tricolor]|nr:MFS transporter [Streptomyces tricolor]
MCWPTALRPPRGAPWPPSSPCSPSPPRSPHTRVPGALDPGLLLGLTFLLGCGTALMGPAWRRSSRNWWSASNWGRRRRWGP